MTAKKDEIPHGRWWVRLARPLVTNYEPSLVALSKQLAKKSGRAKPWSHAALSRFVATGSCSADLANAISLFFKIPRPAFVARSVEEAHGMEAVASQYDGVKLSDIEAEIIEIEHKLAERKRHAEELALRDAESRRAENANEPKKSARARR